MESLQSEEACAITNPEPEIEPIHYVVNINETGESQLLIIQDIIGDDVSIGDEVGMFDMNGVVESCTPDDGCIEPVYGEVLVGSGVWLGEQMEVSCIL